jgi:hypothetical protein
MSGAEAAWKPLGSIFCPRHCACSSTAGSGARLRVTCCCCCSRCLAGGAWEGPAGPVDAAAG